MDLISVQPELAKLQAARPAVKRAASYTGPKRMPTATADSPRQSGLIQFQRRVTMNPASKSRSGGRDAPRGTKEVDTKHKQTPNTDMQGEDAGTAESGVDARGTAAGAAMKQTSKTDAERGSRR
jgi:hypothetical protein